MPDLLPVPLPVAPPAWPARLVATALALQLAATAAVLVGPWQVQSPVPDPARDLESPAAQAQALRPLPSQVPATQVALAAPALWSGSVPMTALGVDRSGALEVPDAAAGLGWWSAGPRPGGSGAAVVVGHVDLDGQAGVFARLAEATPGMIVTVGGTGEPVHFRIVRVDRYPKSRFPTEEVYRPTADAELRLITCGGRFDRRTGHYADNVVVRAVRV